MKPISSAITTFPKGPSVKNGTQAGERGLATPSNGVANVQHPEVLARVPQANLEAAVSSLRACGISVKHEVTGSRFPKEGGWTPVTSLSVKLDENIDEDKARAVLAGLSAPASKDQIIEWLTICAIKTAHKKQDDMTSELKLKVFASELSKYPGDIVRHVLAEWPDKSKWFPEWFDLKTEIDSLSGIRPMIVERVRMKIGAGA